MRYLCVHCHFYQPPRENPWLEQIELQDSAYPYHDWNERITSECYARNAGARILDGKDRIERIVNLYASISFNFGPTLLSWMQEKAPATYAAILRADAEGQVRFGGHGPAIAQCYSHAIMPLCNTRDKRTQIEWGIADFRARFGRMPEGMWLPETGVDAETLSMLAGEGIRYTILAPSQAAAAREMGAKHWKDVTGARIDPKRAYSFTTPSGPIALFFYDGPVSQGVAFERLLDNGLKFANRLLGGFSPGGADNQLMHIATDGETYGHHHKFGEMALAYALRHIETQDLARITNYGEYLELHPPVDEVDILENTAWSCVHGVGRWSRDCGCNSGGNPNWNQKWREPLRAALDSLRDKLTPHYQLKAGDLLKDPWKARDEYIAVVLDRSSASRQAFLDLHGACPLTQDEAVIVWELLEMQRHLMLMYTSCGWFFDEISGIETVQVIQYAARAVQLAGKLFKTDFEKEFISALSLAHSNVHEQRDGASIYRKQVRPSMADLTNVGAHYAVSSMFERHADSAAIFCYDVQREELREKRSGKIQLSVGRARITSRITLESEPLQYAVLHFGDQNIHARVGPFTTQKTFERIAGKLTEAFESSDLAAVIRVMDRNFNTEVNLKSLFKDAQRRIAGQIVEPAVEDASRVYLRLYRQHGSLLRMLREMRIPEPDALRGIAAHALNGMLNETLGTIPLDAERVRGLAEEALSAAASIDATLLEVTLRQTIDKLANQFFEQTSNLEALDALRDAAVLARSLPFPVSLWALQNRCYLLLNSSVYQTGSAVWREGFRKLCEAINLHLD
jgi:alpha-amylase/alpha-mannosidase (GH57 family)